MKTTRIVLSLIVLAILWGPDVFAHMTPAAHFCPGDTKDPCEGTQCEVGSRYDGGHGHIDTYRDKNGNNRYDDGEENSWGYWTKGGYAVVRGDAPDIGCGEGNSVTPVFSISVISGPGSGTPGSQLTFVVEVRRDGTAASGQTVDFSITSGNGNASLGTTSTTTGSNGRAQTILTLGSNASGSYTITATSNSKSASGTATVQTSPPPPPPSTFSINVVSSPGSGEPGDTLTFAVEVLQDGSLTQGLTVDFSITSGDGNASLGSASETTGSNGRAQTTLILSSSASGSYTITATSNGVSTTGTATVQTPPSQQTYTIHVISGPGSGAPGSQLTFVVEVRRDGTAASGQTVDFSITSGDGNASLGTTSTPTGSNGRAQTTLILGNSASGSYSITATSQGQSVSGTATVQTSDPPPPTYSISVISGPGAGAPGETLTFVVQVNQDENPAQGQTVAFSITSGDGNASLGTQSTMTGSNGRAQTTLILGNSASGSYSITATSQGQSVSGTATVTGGGGNNGGGNNGGGNNGGGNNGGGNPDRNPNPNPPPPAVATKLVKISGDDQEGLINTELANPFIVEVHDQNNAAFGGATVTFAITAGGGSLSTTITTTGANGRAESKLTLGPNLGTNTVSVSVEGIQGTETFSAEAVETLTPPTDGNNDGNGNNDGGNNQEPDIPQRTDSESETDRRFAFQLDLFAGWNFVHIPLEVTQVDGQSMSIETLGNLFQILMPANMYIYDGTCWMEVFGDSTQGLAPTQGVAVYMDAPKTVNLVGTPLPTSFTLERGMNFVGLPRQSAALRKVSDFLTFYPDVCAVLVAVDGELYLVGRAGDSGDVGITGGQAFGIISVEQYMTSFGGAAWGKVLLE